MERPIYDDAFPKHVYIWNTYLEELNSDLSVKSAPVVLIGSQPSGLDGLTSSFAATFSPDGKHIAFSRGGDLWLADFGPSPAQQDAGADLSEERIVPAEFQWTGWMADTWWYWIDRISWSPNGALVAVSGSSRWSSGYDSVAVYAAKPPYRRVLRIAGARSAAFSPSGKLVYVDRGDAGQWEIFEREPKGPPKLLLENADSPCVVSE